MIENFYYRAKDHEYKKLVIFDRDDTLIRDVPNLKSSFDIEWLPGRIELLKALSDQSALIAIAINQSAIGRRELSAEEFIEISEFIRIQLQEQGIKLWAQVACPHSPVDKCKCRKPMPGLLNRLVEAAGQKSLEIAFVGNSDTDMEAAQNSEFRIIGIQVEPQSSVNFERVLNPEFSPIGQK